jgi:hypothetical protein
MFIRYYAVNSPNSNDNVRDYNHEYTCEQLEFNTSHLNISMDDIGYNEIVKIKVSASERKLQYLNDTLYDRIYL